MDPVVVFENQTDGRRGEVTLVFPDQADVEVTDVRRTATRTAPPPPAA